MFTKDYLAEQLNMHDTGVVLEAIWLWLSMTLKQNRPSFFNEEMGGRVIFALYTLLSLYYGGQQDDEAARWVGGGR
jgi:hypothetical protein